MAEELVEVVINKAVSYQHRISWEKLDEDGDVIDRGDDPDSGPMKPSEAVDLAKFKNLASGNEVRYFAAPEILPKGSIAKVPKKLADKWAEAGIAVKSGERPKNLNLGTVGAGGSGKKKADADTD